MRYNKIRKMDISNGPGVRVSIFLQGCEFNCKDCFNKETHDFNGGLEFNDEVIEKVIKLCNASHIEGLSILGGEPMHPKNILGTYKLAKRFKEEYPNKTIWVWSGFLFEGLSKEKVMEYIDVLVDGKYMCNLYSPKLVFRGSSNQRIIDVKKSLEKNKIIEMKEVDLICA